MKTAFSLAERIHPFLLDADRAITENARLRELVGQLQHELRYSQEMQDRAADRVDTLETEKAALETEKEAALTEVAMLKTRMKVFGDAASMILTDAPTGQLSGVVAQANERRAQERAATVPASPASELLKLLA